MAIRLIGSQGIETDAAVINITASGTINPNTLVEFSRSGNVGVYPGSSTTTTTTAFGVAMDYAQGASDVIVRVMPFIPGQLWEVDCVNAASTAQVGLRHVMDDKYNLRNTATDTGSGNAFTAIFKCLAMRGLTTGSGILIGTFRTQEAPVASGPSTGSYVG